VAAALTPLLEGAAELGLELPPEAEARFMRHIDELSRWSDRLNLTAIGAKEDIVRRHFLESLALLATVPFPAGSSVLDVGSGAGFPGMPIKVARPDLAVTLLDSSRRRIAFLEHLRRALDLEDVQVVWGRAEDLARAAGRREAFSCVVARAVAPPMTTLELCIPFVMPGGFAAIMIGPRAESEVALFDPLARLVRKVNSTPPEFPRRRSRMGTVP
jgi:16S rRNA (guanine527-N7)-methyltransferase